MQNRAISDAVNISAEVWPEKYGRSWEEGS